MGLKDLRLGSLADLQEKEPTESVTKLTNEEIKKQTEKLKKDTKAKVEKKKTKKDE